MHFPPIPAVLDDYWVSHSPQIQDHAERLGLQWDSFTTQLSDASQEALRRVLILSDFVADALPRDYEWFTSVIIDGRIDQQVTREDFIEWLSDFSAAA